MNNNFKIDKLELPGELGLGEIIKFVSNNIYGILIVIVMIILGTIYVVYNNINENEVCIGRSPSFKQSRSVLF